MHCDLCLVFLVLFFSIQDTPRVNYFKLGQVKLMWRWIDQKLVVKAYRDLTKHIYGLLSRSDTIIVTKFYTDVQ